MKMGTFKTIDEARAYFSADWFATEKGMTPDELFVGTGFKLR